MLTPGIERCAGANIDVDVDDDDDAGDGAREEAGDV